MIYAEFPFLRYLYIRILRISVTPKHPVSGLITSLTIKKNTLSLPSTIDKIKHGIHIMKETKQFYPHKTLAKQRKYLYTYSVPIVWDMSTSGIHRRERMADDIRLSIFRPGGPGGYFQGAVAMTSQKKLGYFVVAICYIPPVFIFVSWVFG